MEEAKKLQLAELKKKLTPEQYNICFLKGTEPPFSGKYTYNKEKGIYRCVACTSRYLPRIQSLTPRPDGPCRPAAGGKR